MVRHHVTRWKKMLGRYTRTKIWFYETETISDSTLWDLFRMDFEGFTTETFSKLDGSTLLSLRICLRCGGVWVPPNSRNLSIHGTFMKVLEEDEQHEWSQDDVKQASSDLSKHTITSVFITLERNLRPEVYARIDAYTSRQTTPKPQTAVPAILEQSTYDPCLLHSNRPFGIVGLQTDDTLFVGDDEFAEQEQLQLQKAGFLAKGRERLTSNHDLKFNSSIIHLKNDSITLTQERQCKNLKIVNSKNTTTTSSRGTIRQDFSIKDQYIAQRARGAYIASVCQPEAAYNLSICQWPLKLSN